MLQIVISIVEFENTNKQFVPETRIQAITTKWTNRDVNYGMLADIYDANSYGNENKSNFGGFDDMVDWFVERDMDEHHGMLSFGDYQQDHNIRSRKNGKASKNYTNTCRLRRIPELEPKTNTLKRPLTQDTQNLKEKITIKGTKEKASINIS
ncbi:hypothetical protein RIR_jg14343.t1 [Rhizophagus irregularis DAOM 181602=DAOM 197198]|nr:hypothetical protein RIR_jg14343.t1 [Rhizophagus irregularis DAOM 181602=DAOM 197198]